MAYEGTEVPVGRSQEAIRKLILANAGTGIAFVSQPPQEGFHALMPLEGKTYTIRIVARRRSREEIGKALQRERSKEVSESVVERYFEQEERRIWRVLYYHLKGLFEAANTGVLEFRELILPYIVTKDGRTIAEHILPGLESAIAGRPDRLLAGRVGDEKPAGE